HDVLWPGLGSGQQKLWRVIPHLRKRDRLFGKLLQDQPLMRFGFVGHGAAPCSGVVGFLIRWRSCGQLLERPAAVAPVGAPDVLDQDCSVGDDRATSEPNEARPGSPTLENTVATPRRSAPAGPAEAPAACSSCSRTGTPHTAAGTARHARNRGGPGP